MDPGLAVSGAWRLWSPPLAGLAARPGPGEPNLLYRICLRTRRGSKGGQTWGVNGGSEGLGCTPAWTLIF